MKLLKYLCLSCVASLVFAQAFAMGGSRTHALGIGAILMSPSQDDLGASIDAFNAANGTAISKPSTAYEGFIQYSYRFPSTMFALVIRPSYFTQTTSGNGSSYALTGYTIFPMLKLYPLENNFIHFFLQTGVGYGSLTGKINHPNSSLTFSGGGFGALVGLGAEFCFTESQCLAVEGNLRYLAIPRSVASASTGNSSEFSQATSGSELEFANNDVKNTMSGIQGGLGYIFNF